MRIPHRPLADLSLPATLIQGGARVEARNGSLHYLNQTAATVWLLSDGTRDLAGIATAVAEIFGLAEPPLADVETALKTLLSRDLFQDG